MSEKPQNNDNQNANLSANDNDALSDFKFEEPKKISFGKQILKSLIVISMIGLFAGGVYLQNKQIRERESKADDKNPTSQSNLKYTAPPADAYSWAKSEYNKRQTFFARVPSLKGFTRPILATDSYANWLRFLPVKTVTFTSLGKQNNSLEINYPKNPNNNSLSIFNDYLQIFGLVSLYRYSHNEDSKIVMPTVDFDLTWENVSRGALILAITTHPKWSYKLINGKDKPDKSLKKFLDFITYCPNFDPEKYLKTQYRRVRNEYPKVGDIIVSQAKGLSAKKFKYAMIVDICVNEKTKQAAFLIVGSAIGCKKFHLLSNPDSTKSPWFVMQKFKPIRASNNLYNACYRLKN